VHGVAVVATNLESRQSALYISRSPCPSPRLPRLARLRSGSHPSRSGRSPRRDGPRVRRQQVPVFEDHKRGTSRWRYPGFPLNSRSERHADVFGGEGHTVLDHLVDSHTHSPLRTLHRPGESAMSPGVHKEAPRAGASAPPREPRRFREIHPPAPEALQTGTGRALHPLRRTSGTGSPPCACLDAPPGGATGTKTGTGRRDS